MSKIAVLPEELINKIAAGEVIERPASVVKELLENSLDAGATRILIEIKNYGKDLIKIIDNGEGMEEEDAYKAVLRHATSKIKSTEDLFAIQTLGFRGEALSSVAAVSRLTITTKQKHALEGFSLVVDGGLITNYGIVAAEKGTMIEVENLFFNTPARKKFLKTDAVELRHIVEVVMQYALINSNVSIKLIHDLKEILHAPSVEEWRDNIAALYGFELAKDLLEVNYENSNLGVKISGFVSKPYDARNDKTMQALFVNRRWVRNEEITKVIYEAYHSLLFVGKHPIFVMNIEIDPTKIDVNVHPTKSDIKIEQKQEVLEAVQRAVREALQQNDLIPELDFQAEQQLTFGQSIPKEEVKPQFKYVFEKSAQVVLPIPREEGLMREEVPLKEEVYFQPLETIAPEPTEKLPPYKLLGQIHKTFFVAETPGGVLFIDQHVVQERVLYEKFMEQFLNKRVAVQNLLQGEVLELNATQNLLLKENLNYLFRMGFALEEFGENTFLLKTIPSVFGRLQPKELLFEIIAGLYDGKNRLEEIQEEIITRMACRASVKAGDELSVTEMQGLLNQLGQTKFPYTCPHGRAVLIKFGVDELEKKFRRK
ncbi:MAG: DNA mismatch repair endonuclease MutL [Nanoarchaeota archaeon]